MSNLVRDLGTALRGGPCTVFAHEIRVRITKDKYLCPDIFVVEGALQSSGEEALDNPKLIIEVLSPTTSGTEYGSRFFAHLGLKTLTEYILVLPYELRIERYRRLSDGQWSLRDCRGADAVCQFESLDVAIQLSDIYEKVEFLSE